MKKISANLYTEGSAHQPLVMALKEFFEQEPFDNGLDWEFHLLWAVMTDAQHLMFILKHPEYQHMFKELAV